MIGCNPHFHFDCTRKQQQRRRRRISRRQLVDDNEILCIPYDPRGLHPWLQRLYCTRPAALTNPVTVAAAKEPAPLNMCVDWGVPGIANAPALSSIYSLFACVAIWELVTPARKDYNKK
jgi:hypothetical protein